MRTLTEHLENCIRVAYDRGKVTTGLTDDQLWQIVATNPYQHNPLRTNTDPDVRAMVIRVMRAAYDAAQPGVDEDYLTAPIPGIVWVLHVKERRGPHLREEALVYDDPVVAVGELASGLCERWSAARTRRPQLPQQPPANDFAAVAVFYTDTPGEHEPGHESFDLYPLGVNTLRAAHGAAADHVLIRPGMEILCLCGNTTSDGGFEPSTPHGAGLGEQGYRDGTPYCLCHYCGRVIDTRTGHVVARIGDADDPNPNDTAAN